jgi:CO dehydrogenase/acetyl-CoA synthase beta subunit
MELFKKHIQQINSFLEQKRIIGKVSESNHQDILLKWPKSDTKTLIMNQDTAVELGNPNQASTSFLLWTNEKETIQNRRVSIVGQDFSGMKNKQNPFGKIVIIGSNDFDDENSYPRYRALEKIRYNLHLKGYMMRGASQFQREWSRVSLEAVNNGFSLHILGQALMDKYIELSFVSSVEIIFITSAPEDVLEIKSISDNTMKIIGAMNKMAQEMSFDCDTCEYTDVCSEVDELRSMRKTYKTRESNAHE